MADTEQEQAAGTAGFLLEMGMLKRAKRSGWWIAGVKDPETIAEHSFRTALIGSVLAMMEGADPARTALLGLWHDTQETRVGDIPHIGRRYLDAADNQSVTADQLADAHPAVRSEARRIVDDYENGDSLEVACARDADKLECASKPSSTANKAARTSSRGSTAASPSSGQLRHGLSPKQLSR